MKIGHLLSILAVVVLVGCQVVVPATSEPDWDALVALAANKNPTTDPPLPELNLRGLSEEEATAAKVYHQHNRAVVNITALVRQQGLIGSSVGQATGSGSIIDQEGSVLTNFHVIENAGAVIVTLYDGSAYPAEFVGADPENDLALIRFAPNGRRLWTVPLGAPEDVVVGQRVYALGNPFGLERTLTTGIISALERPLVGREGYIMRDLIQTDAAINPGNSGGPLLNGRGEMVGINTMIISPGGGSVGIGFAVPIATAHRVIPDLREYGRVMRGWIDIMPMPVIPVLVRLGSLPVAKGIIVSEVESGSMAAAAGLRAGDKKISLGFIGRPVYVGGDIIVAMNGQDVANFTDYFGALESTRPGEKMELEIMREGRKLGVEITLSERPGAR
jgi:S1-C subfamily serine protease